jgi:hypothetical protein
MMKRMLISLRADYMPANPLHQRDELERRESTRRGRFFEFSFEGSCWLTPPEQAWNLWVNHYGPAKTLAANLDDARRGEFKRAMIAWHETFASPLGFDQPRNYWITRGVRR